MRVDGVCVVTRPGTLACATGYPEGGSARHDSAVALEVPLGLNIIYIMRMSHDETLWPHH